MKIKGPIWRVVFAPRNSVLASGNWRNLLVWAWWMDATERGGCYLHVADSEECTHRLYPRRMDGYVCERIAMRGGRLCWLYDAVKEAPQ